MKSLFNIDTRTWRSNKKLEIVIVGLLSIPLGILLGLLSLKITSWIISAYRLVIVLFGGLIILGILLSRSIPRTLLILFVFAIPLNFSYSPFYSHTPGHSGGAQPYIALFLYDFPLIAFIGYWFSSILMTKKRLDFNSIDIFAALFIVWSTFSLLNTVDFTVSLIELLRLIKFYLFFILLSNFIHTKDEVLMVFPALLGGVIIQAGIGAIQYLTHLDLNLGFFVVGELRRISGTIGWPNTLGAYSACIIAIALMNWLLRDSKKGIWFSGIAAVVGLFPLLLSFSRGAWISLMISLAAGILMARKYRMVEAKTIGRLFLIVFLILIAASPLITPVLSRLATTNSEQGSIQDRVRLMMVAFEMIKSHPIIGIGINTFVEVMRLYDRTGVSFYFAFPVHNYYLLVGAETGLVGLGIFFAMIAVVFQKGLRLARSGGDLSVLPICLLTGLSVLLVSNLFDVHLATNVLMSMFWLLIGLISALSRISIHEQKIKSGETHQISFMENQ